MSNLVLSAAIKTPFGLTAAAGLQAAAETALTGNTGFQFPNSPSGLVVVHFVTGSAGTGSLQFVAQTGSNPAAITVANSAAYWFGPFDPAVYSDRSGNVFATLTVVTGSSVGVYFLPNGTPGFGALHNPFEMTVGASDY